MDPYKRFTLGFLLFTVFLIIAYRIFYTVFRVNVLDTIYQAKEIALLFIGFIIASESIRAVRLSIIYREIIGYEGSWFSLYKRSLVARFSSNVVSTVTPGATGGEFIRGLVVSGLKKELIPAAVAVGLADGLYDLFTNVAIAIILLPLVKPLITGLIIILIGLGSSVLWILTLLVVCGKIQSKILFKIPFINHPAIKKSSEAIINSFSKRILFKSLLLSIIGWLLLALGYYFVALYTCRIRLNVFEALTNIMYAFLLGIIPTPAGLVTMDAWLASTSCPSAAVLWRTSGLLSVIVMAVLSIPHIISIVKEYSLLSSS